MTAALADARARVLLVRDMPEQRLRSMERLADGVERAFAEHPVYAVAPFALHASPAARLRPLARLDSYATRFLRYPLAARARPADVYHVIDHGYAHAAALLPPARAVVSCHDLMLLKAAAGEAGFQPGRLSLARFRWTTGFLRRAARIVCPTEATKRDVVRFLRITPERIDVVPYGVEPSFRPLASALRDDVRRRLVGEAHMVLQVSTGDPYKNTEGALRAFAALLRAGVDARLVRAGAPLTPPQHRLARALGVGAAVVDCGSVPEPALVELYNAADVLLFPSHAEGFGWPPLEAMACGTPVVASDAAALVEACDGAALHAPASDDDALARQLRRVLEDVALADTLRMRGFAHAGRFTWKRTADGFARAWDVVLAAAGAKEVAPCAA